MRETLDVLNGEAQIFRETLAVHAREALSVAQFVDFDGDSEENVVRVFKPVAEPGIQRLEIARCRQFRVFCVLRVPACTNSALVSPPDSRLCLS